MASDTDAALRPARCRQAVQRLARLGAEDRGAHAAGGGDVRVHRAEKTVHPRHTRARARRRSSAARGVGVVRVRRGRKRREARTIDAIEFFVFITRDIVVVLVVVVQVVVVVVVVVRVVGGEGERFVRATPRLGAPT